MIYVETDPTKFCTYDEFEAGASTLKEFCLLRAQSISEQLKGTIGSTSDTQESDSLINADNINVNEMGSMKNSDGNEKVPGQDDFKGQAPDTAWNDFKVQAPGTAPNDFKGQAPDKAPNDFKGQAPDTRNISDNSEQDLNSSTSALPFIIPILTTIVIFAAGLCFAIFYKRRI